MSEPLTHIESRVLGAVLRMMHADADDVAESVGVVPWRVRDACAALAQKGYVTSPDAGTTWVPLRAPDGREVRLAWVGDDDDDARRVVKMEPACTKAGPGERRPCETCGALPECCP